MKTLLFTALLCTCVPAATFAASDAASPLITRSVIAGERLDLHFANLQQQRTEVQITSLDNGTEHFRKVITKHNGYRLALGLEDLTDGRYAVTVSQGEVVRKLVILKTEAGTMISDWK